MWLYLVPILTTLVGVCTGVWWTTSFTKNTAILITTGKAAWLQLDYHFSGKDYVTYVPYSRLDAARGVTVFGRDNTKIPFHPGAIPPVPAELFGVELLKVKRGVKTEYKSVLTELGVDVCNV